MSSSQSQPPALNGESSSSSNPLQNTETTSSQAGTSPSSPDPPSLTPMTLNSHPQNHHHPPPPTPQRRPLKKHAQHAVNPLPTQRPNPSNPASNARACNTAAKSAKKPILRTTRRSVQRKRRFMRRRRISNLLRRIGRPRMDLGVGCRSGSLTRDWMDGWINGRCFVRKARRVKTGSWLCLLGIDA